MNPKGLKRTKQGWRHYKQLRAMFKNLKGGLSIAQGCKIAGLDVSTFWDWRMRSPRLDQLVEKMINSRIQVAEDQLYKKVLEGHPISLIFFLCNRAADRWHNVADIKNIIINQNAKKDEDNNSDFKVRPRIVFSDADVNHE